MTAPPGGPGGRPLVDLDGVDPGRPALRAPDRAMTYGALATATRATAARLLDALPDRSPDALPVVAVPAGAAAGTVVAVLAALRAGVAALPVPPGAGADELAHLLGDADPALVLAERDLHLPEALARLPRVPVDVDGRSGAPGGASPLPAPPPAGAPALVVYTSGTTGPPKGVVLSHGALAADLDALAAAWDLRADDVLVHALPLFHVHGLVLATLGPLRAGAAVRYLGRFDAAAVAGELRAGATVLYGVPTMYHRLADALEGDPSVAAGLRAARLLVSGSAGLPAHDRDRITAATGRPVLERYGMTETLITCAMTARGAGEPGTVGPPLPGVALRLVDDRGAPVPADDHDTVGEIQVRGATLFNGYLRKPEATAACFTGDGWFRTGDLATWSPTGAVRICGRRSVDLIKSGGHRIGAGEVENALLGHPDVAEVAVTAEPDADLGERIVAWVVPVRGTAPAAEELVAHVTAHLAAHKRPRVVRFVPSLPRNELGKVQKRALIDGRWPDEGRDAGNPGARERR